MVFNIVHAYQMDGGEFIENSLLYIEETYLCLVIPATWAHESFKKMLIK